MTADAQIETKTKLKIPSLYVVVLHNDDFTPMDLVIMILRDLFHKSTEEAMALTMEIHEQGKGVCGIYTKDVAETKVSETMQVAQGYGFPLKATVENQ